MCTGNQVREYGVVSCRICGVDTLMLGTRLCDRCYELETRIQRDPMLAARILEKCNPIVSTDDHIQISNVLAEINSTIYAVGAPLGSNEYFKIRGLCTETKSVEDEVNEDYAQAMATDSALRTALQGLLDMYVSMVNSGYCGNWDPETEDEVIAARKALRGDQ